MLQGVLSQARPQTASLTSTQCSSSPAWHTQPTGNSHKEPGGEAYWLAPYKTSSPADSWSVHAAMPPRFPLPSALLSHRLTGTFTRSGLYLIDRGTEALPSSATRNMNGNLISCHCMPQPFDRLSAWNVKQTASAFVVPTRSTR